jgi:hypothetical protein
MGCSVAALRLALCFVQRRLDNVAELVSLYLLIGNYLTGLLLSLETESGGGVSPWLALLLTANALFIAWMMLLSAEALAPSVFARVRGACCGSSGNPRGPCACCAPASQAAADDDASAGVRCARWCGACWCGNEDDDGDASSGSSGDGLYAGGQRADAEQDSDRFSTPYLPMVQLVVWRRRRRAQAVSEQEAGRGCAHALRKKEPFAP